MKSVDRRKLEQRLAVWEKCLLRLNEMGPESDSEADLQGFGELKDYLLELVEKLQTRLTKAVGDRRETRGRKSLLLGPKANGLLARDNASHNQSLSGVKNG